MLHWIFHEDLRVKISTRQECRASILSISFISSLGFFLDMLGDMEEETAVHELFKNPFLQMCANGWLRTSPKSRMLMAAVPSWTIALEHPLQSSPPPFSFCFRRNL